MNVDRCCFLIRCEIILVLYVYLFLQMLYQGTVLCPFLIYLNAHKRLFHTRMDNTCKSPPKYRQYKRLRANRTHNPLIPPASTSSGFAKLHVRKGESAVEYKYVQTFNPERGIPPPSSLILMYMSSLPSATTTLIAGGCTPESLYPPLPS